MKKQQRKRTHLDHSEMELDGTGNQNCPARQSSHFPGSASSLDSISEELDEEFDECQIARNVPPVQEGESINEVSTAMEQNEEISGYKVTGITRAIHGKDGEKKNADSIASEMNGEVDSSQVARNVAPILDENGETRNDFNRESGKNRKFDGHQATRNPSPAVDTKGESRNDNIEIESHKLQKICPPDSDQCNPEESTQILRRDILDNQYLSEEDKRKVGVTANKKYFLDKSEFQLKCSSEHDARHHPEKLNPAQAFVHPMSSRGAKKYKESIGVDKEYLRRDSKFRDESSREQGVTGDQRHSGNMRPGSLHSQGVNTGTVWLIIGAIFMTFSTAVLVVILWEHLSIVSLQRKPCFNSSKLPIMPDIVLPKTW